MSKITTIIIIIIILIAGWYFFANNETDPNVEALNAKAWEWVSTTYNNDTQIAPKDAGVFTITFKDDDTFSATTDCNAMSGGYETNDNQITFGLIAMTEMYCEGSQEQEFAKMLGEINSFFFTDTEELVFDLKFDSGSSIFR